jgi:DNA-nicking Smr family endonuclease
VVAMTPTTGACRWWRCAADVVRQRARRWFASSPLVQAYEAP